jgi:hypothetical protein
MPERAITLDGALMMTASRWVLLSGVTVVVRIAAALCV